MTSIGAVPRMHDDGVQGIQLIDGVVLVHVGKHGEPQVQLVLDVREHFGLAILSPIVMKPHEGGSQKLGGFENLHRFNGVLEAGAMITMVLIFPVQVFRG